MMETAISTRVCMCRCEELSNKQPKVPLEKRFVAGNDRSHLVQTRIVGKMSGCCITRFCSFKMFGVIKTEIHKGLCIKTVIMESMFMLMPAATRLRTEFLFATLNYFPA